MWCPGKRKDQDTGNAEVHPGGGLYNLRDDIGEAKDLSAELPELKAALIRAYGQAVSGFPEPLVPPEGAGGESPAYLLGHAGKGAVSPEAPRRNGLERKSRTIKLPA